MGIDNRFFKVKGVWVGLVLGLAYGLTFYLLSLIVWECLRLFSITEVYEIWEVTEEGRAFLQWFFAALSLVVGQSICFRYWFEVPIKRYSRIRRAKRSRLLVDQQNLIWISLGVLLKLGIAIGVGGLLVLHNAEFSAAIYPTYWYVFVLLPLVLFLQSWNSALQVLNRKYLYLFLSAIFITSASYGLSKYNPLDKYDFDQMVEDQNIEKVYDIRLPIITEKKHCIHGDAHKLYLKGQSKEDLIMIFDGELVTSLDSAFNVDGLSFFLHYHIDAEVPMELVVPVLKQRSNAEFVRSELCVYPESAPVYAEYGYYVYPKRIPEFDWSNEAILKEYNKRYNKVEIQLNDKLYVSSKEVFGMEEFRQELYDRLTSDPYNVIVFKTSKKTDFQRFIQVDEQISMVIDTLIDTLREKEAQSLYGASFDVLELELKKRVARTYRVLIDYKLD